MTAKGLVCGMQMQSADLDTLSQLRDHGHMPPRHYNTVQMKVNKTQTHTRLHTFPLLVILARLRWAEKSAPKLQQREGSALLKFFEVPLGNENNTEVDAPPSSQVGWSQEEERSWKNPNLLPAHCTLHSAGWLKDA